MIGSVDFSKYNEYDENGEVINKMYEAFNVSIDNSQNENIKKYITFDDAHKTAWIMWYDGGLQ